jgi:hypothetical protein
MIDVAPIRSPFSVAEGYGKPIEGLRPMENSVRLTSEERLVLHRWSDQCDTPYRRFLGHYAAIFLPMASFAGYGVIRRDWIALLIAFAGLFLYQIWEVSYNVSRAAVHRALLTKLAEREFGEHQDDR